jgi:hypothetical protein
LPALVNSAKLAGKSQHLVFTLAKTYIWSIFEAIKVEEEPEVYQQ